MRLYHRLRAAFTGRNTASTPIDVISAQMNEPRQLPVGAREFDEWSDRIISGVPPLDKVDPEGMKFALATMIMQLGPHESHKPDLYFLKGLLKSASNQIAHAKMVEIKDAAKARLSAEDAEKVRINTELNAAALKRTEEAGNRTLDRMRDAVAT